MEYVGVPLKELYRNIVSLNTNNEKKNTKKEWSQIFFRTLFFQIKSMKVTLSVTNMHHISFLHHYPTQINKELIMSSDITKHLSRPHGCVLTQVREHHNIPKNRWDETGTEQYNPPIRTIIFWIMTISTALLKIEGYFFFSFEPVDVDVFIYCCASLYRVLLFSELTTPLKSQCLGEQSRMWNTEYTYIFQL